MMRREGSGVRMGSMAKGLESTGMKPGLGMHTTGMTRLGSTVGRARGGKAQGRRGRRREEVGSFWVRD
jgi:hypothetical protein